MPDKSSSPEALPQIPASLDFIASHGRMFANFSGEFVLEAFGVTVGHTDGNLGEAWTLCHIVWISMDTKLTGERQRIWDLDKAVPESVLAPVRIATLARAAGLPYETAKRYVLALVEQGLCSRQGGGYVPSASFMASEAVVRSMMHTIFALSILVKKLDASGMLEYLRDRDFSAIAAKRP